MLMCRKRRKGTSRVCYGARTWRWILDCWQVMHCVLLGWIHKKRELVGWIHRNGELCYQMQRRLDSRWSLTRSWGFFIHLLVVVQQQWQRGSLLTAKSYCSGRKIQGASTRERVRFLRRDAHFGSTEQPPTDPTSMPSLGRPHSRWTLTHAHMQGYRPINKLKL